MAELINVNGRVRPAEGYEITQMRELLAYHGFHVPTDPDAVVGWWKTFEPRFDPENKGEDEEPREKGGPDWVEAIRYCQGQQE